MQGYTVSSRAGKQILVYTLMKNENFVIYIKKQHILNRNLSKMNHRLLLPSLQPEEHNHTFSFQFMVIMNTSDWLKPKYSVVLLLFYGT